MKTIAVPLLLAGSAQAQTPAEERRARALAGDRGVPAPTLIADAWQQGDCTNDAVTAAASALAAAETALSTKKADLPALQTAQTAALDANTAAVQAVITAETAVAAAMKTDDDLEKAKVGLKKLLDDANYDVTAKTAAKATADTALTTATTAETAATTLHGTLSTAATNALNAYNTATTTLGTASTTGTAKELADAETAYNTENGLIANLSSLATSAKTTWDTNLATTTTKLEPQQYEAFRKTKAEALRTTATTGTTAVAATSLAAYNTATAAGTSVAYITTGTTWTAKGTTWQTLAKAATAGVKAWLAVDEVAAGGWTTVAAASGAGCLGLGSAVTTATNVAGTAVNDEAKCKAACAELKPWAVDGTSGFPNAAAATTGTGYCYAMQWDAGGSTCKIFNQGLVAVTGNDACMKRVKSDGAAALWTKIDNAATTKTAYTDFISEAAGSAWYADLKAAYLAVYTLEMQKDIDADLDTAFGTWLGTEFVGSGVLAYWTAQSEYTTAKGISDGNETAYNTKAAALTAQQAVVAQKLAIKNAKNAANVEALADQARKLVLKGRADAALAAQALVKTAAETAKTTAGTAATAAATALTTATTAQTSAQTNYNTQATAATNAAAPDLTALVAARTAAGTKATALEGALTALANAQGVADTAQATADAAKATHLAAIVACKEAKFDQYAAALQTAKAARTAAMTTIETLVDAAEAKRPAAGAAGARCEKAPSNGTRRPARGETTCATGLCCGAASGPLRTAGRATAAGAVVAGSALSQATTTVTIETCQPAAATQYAFRPPRAPMATAAPAEVTWAFACIEGAQKLAAAASALATAAYILA